MWPGLILTLQDPSSIAFSDPFIEQPDRPRIAKGVPDLLNITAYIPTYYYLEIKDEIEAKVNFLPCGQLVDPAQFFEKISFSTKYLTHSCLKSAMYVGTIAKLYYGLLLVHSFTDTTPYPIKNATEIRWKKNP